MPATPTFPTISPPITRPITQTTQPTTRVREISGHVRRSVYCFARGDIGGFSGHLGLAQSKHKLFADRAPTEDLYRLTKLQQTLGILDSKEKATSKNVDPQILIYNLSVHLAPAWLKMGWPLEKLLELGKQAAEFGKLSEENRIIFLDDLEKKARGIPLPRFDQPGLHPYGVKRPADLRNKDYIDPANIEVIHFHEIPPSSYAGRPQGYFPWEDKVIPKI